MVVKMLFSVVGLLLILCLGLVALRIADLHADRAIHRALMHNKGASALRFDPSMLDGLPEPARRLFHFSIRPGSVMGRVAIIEMGGTLSLGTKDEPNEQAMTAWQILAPPHGFLWQVRLAGGARITGSDAYAPHRSWSRFRLLDLVPVGRVSRDEDHLRSAFGRMVGEGLFWTPAVFLPAAEAGWDSVFWEAVDADTARVTVRHEGLEQTADVTVDAEGRPLRVVFQRWSNENPERIYKPQPFGGDLSEFRSFDGFTLPTRVTGGNHFGTDHYHPFFKAKVTEIVFP